jgi:uncharacterized surface protein with fasciclin (FAS1) repeats
VLCLGVTALAVGCGGSGDTATTEAMATADEAMPEPTEGVEVGGEMMTPDLTIAENAANAPNLTTLVGAVQAADLVETLNGPGPFTVFAPTNDAFEKVDPAALEDLMKPENKDQLAGVLTYHVVEGALTSSDLEDGQTLKTVSGGKLEISEKNGHWYVNGAMIETPDVIDSNGVSHVIDAVLLPPAK